MDQTHPPSRRTSRRGVLLIGVFAAGMAVAGPVEANEPVTDSTARMAPSAVPGSAARIDPALGSATGTQRVLVRLAASPVALGGSAARVERQQDSFVDTLTSGVEAEVLATVDTVLNGVFLSVDAADVGRIAADPRVESVSLVRDYELDLADTVLYIGATAVHESGQTGVGVEVAVLDSGIDYTHAAFGGAGTRQAYEAAAGVTSTSPLAATLDGLFPTAKVVGGFDFVGEFWPGPTGSPVAETSDPDPIDREGHGTHVADIIGGVDGVAPGVSLHAVKVCSAISSSCSGMGMIQGMEYAVDPNDDSDTSDHVDIVNMSIGSPYGQWFDDDVSAAVDAATAVGVLTVASAGNSGDRPYITGTPGGAPTALSVAQTAVPTLRYHNVLVTSPAAVYDGLLQAWSPFTSSVSGTLQFGAGSNTLGCDAFTPGSLVGKIVLLDRGVCNASFKAYNVEQAGGVATIIGNVQDSHFAFTFGGDPVVNPVFVVRRSDATALKSAVGATVSMAPNDTRLVNTAGAIVSTSSRGPTLSDGSIKPEIGAPGASVSARVGTGTVKQAFGGTSGAAPMVAGSAALVLAAHPDRPPVEVKAVLMNAADPDVRNAVGGTLLPITRIGNGEVRVDAAVASRSAAWSGTSSALSFGFVEAYTDDMTLTRTVTVRNYSGSSITYDVSNSFRDPADASSGAVSLSFPPTVTVPASGQTAFDVTMTIDGSLLPGWNGNTAENMDDPVLLNAAEFDGRISLSQGSERLLLAWQVIPRKASNLSLTESTITNNGVRSTTVWPYALIASDPDDDAAVRGAETPVLDLRYFGFRAIPVPGCAAPNDLFIDFALVNWDPIVHPGLPGSYGILVDIDDDGTDDFEIFTFLESPFSTTTSSDSRVYVYDLRPSPDIQVANFAPYHLTNNATTYLGVCASQIGLSPTPGDPLLVTLKAYSLDYWFKRQRTDETVGVMVDLAAPRHTMLLDGASPRGTPLATGQTADMESVFDGSSSSQDVGILLSDPDGAAPGQDAIALVQPEAPAAPAVVAGAPGTASAQLSWMPPPGILDTDGLRYTLEMSTGDGAFETIVASTDATEHTATGLVNGTTYRFRLRAANVMGVSPASAASAAVTPRAVPSAPSGVVGAPGDKRIALTWRTPSSNGGAAITGYRIEMSRGTGAFTTVVANTGNTALRRTITGLTNGVSYRFRVSAINEAGAGGPSAASAALVPRTTPTAPTAVSGVAGRRSVTVTWRAPSSNGGAAITGYRILVSRNGARYTTAVADTRSTSRSHTVTRLATGDTYRFKVAAINAAGVGAESAPSGRVVPR